LTDAKKQIVTVAHQVTANQSSIRTVETGQPYQLPPALTAAVPSLQESQQRWQERVSLIPGSLQRQLLQNYRGLSPAVARSLIVQANLAPERDTESLTETDWQRLFACWQEWLKLLESGKFRPAWTAAGYTVLGWEVAEAAASVQLLLERYYRDCLNQQEFQQIRQQLRQKVGNLLKKLRLKADNFQQRLQESDCADESRQQADLLMAYLQQVQPGMTEILLPDFETGEPVTIPLNPEKSAVQNAQSYYKRHQKLKRSRAAIEPLLQEVCAEIAYLEQVEASLNQMESYQSPADLQALAEIREELIAQGYLEVKSYASRSIAAESEPRRYLSPSGFEVWVGRNNRQNDQLTFRIASENDLWFHVQENAGSHVLLRLPPGAVPETADLQCAADWAAYYSRARHSDSVPIIYVEPKYVYKPKGAKPGMVVYKRERLLWGRPQAAVL
jgi:predicted ribosome quality control (RQC) complex YloA/Tae2 family protein